MTHQLDPNLVLLQSDKIMIAILTIAIELSPLSQPDDIAHIVAAHRLPLRALAANLANLELSNAATQGVHLTLPDSPPAPDIGGG